MWVQPLRWGTIYSIRIQWGSPTHLINQLQCHARSSDKPDIRAMICCEWNELKCFAGETLTSPISIHGTSLMPMCANIEPASKRNSTIHWLALFADISSIDLGLMPPNIRYVSASLPKLIGKSVLFASIADVAVIAVPLVNKYVAGTKKKHTPQPINEASTNALFPVDRMHTAPITQPKNCAVPNKIVA